MNLIFLAPANIKSGRVVVTSPGCHRLLLSESPRFYRSQVADVFSALLFMGFVVQNYSIFDKASPT